MDTETDADFDFDFLVSFCDETKRKGVRIPLKVFLQAYVNAASKNSNSVDLASELGISPQAVRQRVGKLLNQGVKLPKLGNICR